MIGGEMRRMATRGAWPFFVVVITESLSGKYLPPALGEFASTIQIVRSPAFRRAFRLKPGLRTTSAITCNCPDNHGFFCGWTTSHVCRSDCQSDANASRLIDYRPIQSAWTRFRLRTRYPKSAFRFFPARIWFHHPGV